MIGLWLACARPVPVPWPTPLDRADPALPLAPAFGDDGRVAWVDIEPPALRIGAPGEPAVAVRHGADVLGVRPLGGSTVAAWEPVDRRLCALPEGPCVELEGAATPGRVEGDVVWALGVTPRAWRGGTFVDLPPRAARALQWTPTANGLTILDAAGLATFRWRDGALVAGTDRPPAQGTIVDRSLVDTPHQSGWLLADGRWIDAATGASRPLEVRVGTLPGGVPTVERALGGADTLAFVATTEGTPRLQVFGAGSEAWLDRPLPAPVTLAEAAGTVWLGLSDARWQLGPAGARGTADRGGRFFVPGSLEGARVVRCDGSDVLTDGTLWIRPRGEAVELGPGRCPSAESGAPLPNSPRPRDEAPRPRELARACVGELLEDASGRPFVCLLDPVRSAGLRPRGASETQASSSRSPDRRGDGSTWGQFARRRPRAVAPSLDGGASGPD